MDIGKLVLTDTALNAIETGAWVDDFEDFPDIKLKVTGTQSKAARDLLSSLQEKQRISNKGKPLTADQLAAIMREVLAEVVLLDFAGFTSNGKPVKYDKTLAKEWITSRNGERFAGLVLRAAQQVDDRAEDFIKEAVKN